MTTTNTELKNIIAESLAKATSYQEYRTVVQTLAEVGKSTGESQTEDLANYTKLNDRRMKRLDKTTKLTEEAISSIHICKWPTSLAETRSDRIVPPDSH